jgi:hypothetical protein
MDRELLWNCCYEIFETNFIIDINKKVKSEEIKTSSPEKEYNIADLLIIFQTMTMKFYDLLVLPI